MPLVLPSKHDSRVEKRPCDSGCDGDQVALTVEDFYLRRARHFRQIHGAAAANEGGAFFGCGDARQLRHQFSGMDKQRLSIPCCIAASNACKECASSIVNSATAVRRRLAR